ncbi:MAG: ParB family transcriptional regulator, chromosome partitioning protein [Candidatus Cloacimonadota bacterium]|jgi:ParB family chromosome partitioning protein|nr:ParB family transcriptional regulator, chromosome partitioning protein [Candidatus Cloacimonadota bacterium]
MNEHLGRGLSALIPNAEIEHSVNAGIGTIPIAKIKCNRFQPRRKFDPERLQELASSILENGIIQPLIVTKSEGSDYELIAGERRLEAAKLAGLTSVPVVIRSVTKKEQLQLAIIENIQREDLSPVEEALAYQALVEDFGLTHAQIATVMAKDRVTITNSLRLLKLPPEVIELISAEALSAGHARAVLMVEPDYQLSFAQYLIKYKLTVRQAEEKAKSYVHNLQNKSESAPSNPLTRSIEQKLSSLFQLKVKVTEAKGKGKITLEYKSPQELEQLKKILEQLR